MSSENTKNQIVSMLTNILNENDPYDSSSQYEPTTNNEYISISFSSEHSNNENETSESLSKPPFTLDTLTDNNSSIMINSLSPRSPKKHFSHPMTSKQRDNILLITSPSCDDTANNNKCATTPSSPTFTSTTSAFGVNNQNFEILLRKEQSINQTVYAIAKGNVSQLIKRQQTSRLLQYFLMNTDKHLLHLIFLDLVNDLHLLMFDLYANYFCYKLFSYLNQCDRIHFLSLIKDYIAVYATHHIATYPLQCIIEDIHDTPEQEIITNAMNKLLNTNNTGDIMAIATNSYGTHVFEKIMLRFNATLLQPLLMFFTSNLSVLGTNPHGLCVIKKLVQVVYNNKQSMMMIYTELKCQLQQHAYMLSQSPFGNYVLQSVLDIWHTKDSEDVMLPLHNDILQLSSSKYSSNVIEKYLKVNAKFVLFFVNALHIADCCCTSSNEVMYTVHLIKNTYGSYVLETVLQELKGEYLKQFILYLQKVLTVLMQALPNHKGDAVLYGKWLKKINYYYYTYYCGNNVYYCD